MTMKKLCYILVLFILASCNRKSQDTDIFNGEIISIEDHAPEKEVEFKELTLKGLNFGFLAMHDSLAFFMNPKLQTKWFQLFNCHTLDEVGEFVGKGNGHEEFVAVGPIWNFYTENNDVKTLIFDANKESVSVWNITKSLMDSSTVIEQQIRLPWKEANNGACFKELFMKNPNTLYAQVSPVEINEHEATLPYYQQWDLKNEKKISDIHNRVKIGNESSADIFVSIHLNKIPESQYDGWQTFYKEGSSEGQKLAVAIQNNLNNSIQKENNRIAKTIDNIYIINHVEIPITIVECGFLSNPEEEKQLLEDKYQDKLAWGIYNGIIEYFYE